MEEKLSGRSSGVGLCPSSPGLHPQGASLDLFRREDLAALVLKLGPLPFPDYARVRQYLRATCSGCGRITDQGPFAQPALPGLDAHTTLSDHGWRDVEGATLARDGSPRLPAPPFRLAIPHHGGSSGCAYRLLPRSRGLPQMAGWSPSRWFAQPRASACPNCTATKCQATGANTKIPPAPLMTSVHNGRTAG